MHPSFRKLLDEHSKGASTKQAFSNSTDLGSELDVRTIRAALGYDPDDESIEVRFIPASGLFDGDGPVDIDALMNEVTGAVTDEDSLARESTDSVGEARPETGEERWARQYPAVSSVMNEVFAELHSAFAGHRDMVSPHEGYAVILEELDELWELVKRKGGGADRLARKEALQVAAMAIRYVVNLDPCD